MIYFTSDIHLGSGTREQASAVENKFVSWLQSIEHDAETVFIVGDLFDFWFEYHKVVPKGYVRTLGQIARMADKGIRMVLLTGNHDMWVYDYLSVECGMEIYTKPQEMTLCGKRVFVSHGDNTNIKHAPMLRFMNSCFRSKTLRFFFSWLVHPDIALKFGGWWSGSSRKSHGLEHDEKFLEPLKQYAAEYARDHEVDIFVFGHMHIPADVQTPVRMLFLGDWQSSPSYLAMNSDGEISLKILE